MANVGFQWFEISLELLQRRLIHIVLLVDRASKSVGNVHGQKRVSVGLFPKSKAAIGLLRF
jgi:hypothetical protein